MLVIAARMVGGDPTDGQTGTGGGITPMDVVHINLICMTKLFGTSRCWEGEDEMAERTRQRENVSSLRSEK